MGDGRSRDSFAVWILGACEVVQCAIAIQLAGLLRFKVSNVAYNAVGLFEKLIQILFAEDIGLKRPRVMRGEHLVENGRQIHGGVLLQLCRRAVFDRISVTMPGVV